MNSFKLPYHNPFCFRKTGNTRAFHFDEGWAAEQIRGYEMPMYYKQKWIRSKTTTLQCESSIAPQDLQIWSLHPKALVKSIAWTMVLDAVQYKIYELVFDISDIPEDDYILYGRTNLLSIDWKYISEPISSRDSHPGCINFQYWNSYNEWDVVFSTGIKFDWTVEGDLILPDFTPERNRITMINQNVDLINLYSNSYNSFPLAIGSLLGLPPYMLSHANRIFDCDSIKIEDYMYQSAEGSKWEKTYIKGNPFVHGAKIDVVLAKNPTALEFSSAVPLAPGLVTAYEIETDFFGPSTIVPVYEVEENG